MAISPDREAPHAHPATAWCYTAAAYVPRAHSGICGRSGGFGLKTKLYRKPDNSLLALPEPSERPSQVEWMGWVVGSRTGLGAGAGWRAVEFAR